MPSAPPTGARAPIGQGSPSAFGVFVARPGADPIPPPGATNSKGQGRDAALEACKARCQEADGCGALNVVPSAPPPSLAFSTAAASRSR